MDSSSRKHRSRNPSPPPSSSSERSSRKSKRPFLSPQPSARASDQNQDFHFYCFPCDSHGLRKEAYAYCESCTEFLCHTCYKHHRKAKALRKHKLLEKEKMHQVRLRAKSMNDCSGKCPKHPEEIVTWYCRNHFQIGCHLCKTDFHNDCGYKCTPDFQDGPKDADVLEMIKELDAMENKADLKIARAMKNRKIAENYFTAEVQEIRLYRQQLNDHLDTLENAAITDAVRIMEEDKAAMDTIMHECSSAKEEIQRKKHELTSDHHESDGTVFIRHNDPDFVKIKSTLSQNDVCNSIRTLKFEPEKAMFDYILSQTKIGSVLAEEEAEESIDQSTKEELETESIATQSDEDAPKALGAINIKSKSDKRSCYITGMDVLSSDEIVIADSHNDCIKIVDINQKKITSDVKLSFSPQDLTVINKNRVAVTLPCAFLSMIQLVSKFGPFRWRTDHSFKANGTCYGIASVGDKLLVSFTGPPKIEIMGLQGDVLTTITNDLDGQCLFNQPWHLAISPDEKYVYVSDRGYRSLTRFPVNGDMDDVIQISRSADMHFSPEGIAVTDKGSVLVCDMESDADNVYAFSEDLSGQTVIYDNRDKLRHPQTICYSSYQRKVFITCHQDKRRSKIYVFKLFDFENSLK